MTTQLKKSPMGKTYQVSTIFKVGDKVAVHNKISGDVSFIGTIIRYNYSPNQKIIHSADIKIDGIEGFIPNRLGSALVIN